jgi:hypothetical protein
MKMHASITEERILEAHERYLTTLDKLENEGVEPDARGG